MTSVHPRGDVRILHKECHTLASAGHDISLVVADGGGNETHGGVSIVDVGRAEGGRWKRMTTTPNRVLGRALELGAKVYHFHDPELLPAGLALQRKGKKVIYDAHELLPASIRSKHYLPGLSRWVAAHLIGRYERFVAKRLSAVVAATPVIAARLHQVQPRTEVVANFPKVSDINMKPPAWEARDNVVCYQGAISWERGLREMVAAVTQADSRLLLAGAFSDEMDCAAVRRLPGWEDVEELGTLDKPELWTMMRRCRAGLVLFHPFPNHTEAQPNKLFEYMAAGLPVVASNFPLWRELVEGHRCGWCVDPQNPQAIADVIRWLLDHPEEAEAMGRRGRDAVREHFNWGNEADKLLALYESLA